MMSVFLSIIWLLCLAECNASVYFSTISLYYLVKNEQQFIVQLESCLQEIKQSNPTKTINNYLDHHKQMFLNGKTAEAIVQHPIDTFHLMKYIVTDWKKIIDEYDNDKIPGCLKRIQRLRKKAHYPEEKDMMLVAASIARMQTMYNIPIPTMINGTIQANNGLDKVYQSSQPLNCWDCMMIGKAAIDQEYFNSALEWLKASLDLLDNGDYSTSIGQITPWLKEAMTEKDFEDQLLEKTMGALCRGGKIGLRKPDWSLVCKYLTRNNSYLLIAPFKVEELSTQPAIMLFHDFLTEENIIQFKSTAAAGLMASRVFGEEDGPINFDRISAQYWLRRQDNSELWGKVTRRVEAATGLNAGLKRSDDSVPAAEPFQVVNYCSGGLYLSHTDYVADFAPGNCLTHAGDRIATFLIYVSDVKVGGATVFTEADVTVWPEKGSAVFWYNLYTSGDGDESTEHAGCPVLYGTKWISNLWIRQYAQHDYTCHVNRSERHTLL